MLQKDFFKLPNNEKENFCLTTSSSIGTSSSDDVVKEYLINSNNFSDFALKLMKKHGGTSSSFPYYSTGLDFLFEDANSISIANMMSSNKFRTTFKSVDLTYEVMFNSFTKGRFDLFRIFEIYHELNQSKYTKFCAPIYEQELILSKKLDDIKGKTLEEINQLKELISNIKKDFLPFISMYQIANLSKEVLNHNILSHENCEEHLDKFTEYVKLVREIPEPEFRVAITTDDFNTGLELFNRALRGVAKLESIKAKNLKNYVFDFGDIYYNSPEDLMNEFWMQIQTYSLENLRTIDQRDAVRERACAQFDLRA